MTRELMRAIFEGYTLNPHSFHGVYHWARVLENGERIAEETGADVEVVRLFAIFHDCRRMNENRDPDHGRRGGDFAATLRGNLIDLEPSRFELLHYACTHHTDGMTEGDPTVQACWDADRLDLGRVGKTLDRRYLCTDFAKEAHVMEWADERAWSGFESDHAVQWLEWADVGPDGEYDDF